MGSFTSSVQKRHGRQRSSDGKESPEDALCERS